MQTITRVALARKLIADINANTTVDAIIDNNTYANGYVDHEHRDYELEQFSSQIKYVLNSPNTTLPTLDRLREAALENNLI